MNPPLKSILVIDDDTALRHSIAGYLDDAGYTVHQASCGYEGIRLFGELLPDLVLTDLMMAEIDGIGVIQEIRKQSPTTPVVVISGNGAVGYAVDSIRHGAWDYITKPIHDFSTLERVINAVTDRMQEEQEQRRRQSALEESLQSYSELLHENANFDPLTGLPSRQYLSRLFAETIQQNRFSGDLFVMLLDIDNLKSVNKTLGHEFGDRVLIETARRIKQHHSDTRIAGRLGADQFVFMVSDCSNIHTCIASLRQLLLQPYMVGHSELFITGCIGIAIFPHDGESLDSLLQNANAALSQAKRLGANRYAFYSRQLGEQLRERLSIESALHRALERNEFFIEYQPQVCAITGGLYGVEALLRWQPDDYDHPVSPARFIPILEETGMIEEVGNWVLKTACRDMATLERYTANISLSVNISAIQFHSGSLTETVANVLASSGLTPSRLCLELTESIVMQDTDQTLATMQQLRELGVSLSLDDFGTGYSSLAYLQRMPLNEIKIDRSFVENLPDDKNAIAIVESILALANSLQLSIIAEGVETAHQADFLKKSGCPRFQGFLFSKPIPLPDLITTFFL